MTPHNTPPPPHSPPDAFGFQVKNVSFSYAQKLLFKDLSVTIGCREFCSVVGPNGAGKSTFLKLLTRLLEPQVGQILLANQPLADYLHRDLARKITYVPQESFFAWDFTVEETVLQGRYSYLRPLERYHSSDFDRVHAALGRLGIEALAKKGINNISSGERQLAVIARSLVQEPSIILLDEPLNHLDLAHQYQVLSLLTELNS
ncbi:ATP-binding cassette domain-containing protein, partial [candidate division WOR-3 bacterium]|nr:ATP-binding cassette domain-containing protein [candidate division WOR-3 bacterium]MBD3364073.1 ATP-binding cassette domain-containing protein [candidate division WOR-3 bacterium]